MAQQQLVFLTIFIISSSFGQPIYELPPGTWPDQSKETILTPIISSPCTPNGRCWGWISNLKASGATDDNLLQEESIIPPLPPGLSTDQELWRGNSPVFEAATSEIRSASPVIRQISNKPVKKDVFMSRSWGAGGMPFSVLYMNPHGTRSNHSPTPDSTKTSSSVPRKPTDVLSPTKHPNNRLSTRNGASQQRRPYSIIPQLFISYGWGPFGGK